MKRTVLLALVGLAVTAVWAAPAPAQAPPGDSVTGGFFASDCYPWPECGNVVAEFEFDAHSGPSGENPTGTVEWHLGGGDGPTWLGDVTCLAVTGNTAVIGFGGSVVGNPSYYVAGLIKAVDVASGPGDTLDTFEWAEHQGELNFGGGPIGEPLPGPTDCSSYPSSFPGSVEKLIAQNGGDIVITDAQPFPTSKDQCKNGGWRNYGDTFRNQGQCVAFVERGPKP
jgi:hypothetical protein